MTGPETVQRNGSIRGTQAMRARFETMSCPLDVLLDEHYVQRQLTAEMERLAASGRGLPALARSIVLNLCLALPLHHADEDASLFPRLRARAMPEDEVDALLARLEADHAETAAAIRALVPALICLASGALPTSEDRATLVSLAQSERRHLIVENAIVLPLARLRLTRADKAAMLAEMRARRAAPPPPDALCARALAELARPEEGPAP